MRYESFTASNQVPTVQKLSIYRNALELFTLSRKLRLNQHALSQNVDVHLFKTLYEQLLTATISLPFTIAQASVTKEYSKKIYFQKSIANSLHTLDHTCHEMSSIYQSHKKEMHQLNNALKKLKGRFQIWSVQLTQQN